MIMLPHMTYEGTRAFKDGLGVRASAHDIRLELARTVYMHCI